MTSVKEVMSDFAAQTTAHGLGRISVSTTMRWKVFWMVATLSAFSLASWQITILGIRFASNPVETHTSIFYETVEFPAVTFCGLNIIRESKKHLGGDSFMRELIAIQKAVDDQNAGTTGSRRKRTVDQERSYRQAVKHYRRKRATSDCDTATLEASSTEVYCYYFSASGDAYPSLTAAQTECGLTGGEVATLDTESKMQHVNDILDATAPNNRDGYWLSLQRDDTTAEWLWPGETTAAGWVNWITDNPDATPGNNCTVAILNSLDSDHAWENVACSGEPNITLLCQKNVYDVTTAAPEVTTEAPTPTPTATPAAVPTPAPATHTGEIPSCDGCDPADVPFIPESDLSDKPWFNNDGGTDSSVSAAKNVTRFLVGLELDHRRLMGHQLDSMVQECSWAGSACTPNNFTTFYNKRYGNCFTFNSPEGPNKGELYSTKPGPLFGLSMTLYIEQHEYIKVLSPAAGVRVLVHRTEKQPFPDEEGFDVGPGQKSSVNLRLTRFDKIEDEDCTNGTANALWYRNRTYSVRACTKSCTQDLKINRCGCGDAELPLPVGTSVCNTDAENECSDQVDSDVSKNTNGSMCACKELCKDKIFRVSVSKSEWPGEAFKKILVDQFSERENLTEIVQKPTGIMDNFLRLEIFYDEIKYEVEREEAVYPGEKLMGDIGGQLGLFIGVSVMTVVETVFLCVELATLCCRVPRAKKQAAKKNNPGIEDQAATPYPDTEPIDPQQPQTDEHSF